MRECSAKVPPAEKDSDLEHLSINNYYRKQGALARVRQGGGPSSAQPAYRGVADVYASAGTPSPLLSASKTSPTYFTSTTLGKGWK